jgi:hypothetical protein
MPVPDFSPGEVLTAAAMDSIGLWLVKTQTIGTGVSSVTVTDAFSANYDAYKIVITGGTGSSSTELRFRLGAVTSGYRFSFIYSAYGGSVAAVTTSTGSAIEYTGTSTTSSLGANIEVQNPFLTEHTFVQSATATTTFAGSTSGSLETTTSYTDFTIFVGAGTITGGTIRVYGYRN